MTSASYYQIMPIGHYTVKHNGEPIGTIHIQRIPILDSAALYRLLSSRGLILNDEITLHRIEGKTL